MPISPTGLALFLVADIAKVTIKDVLKEMLPFYVPLIARLLLIIYIRWITMVVPNWALGN
ncbi:MAG: TRAP transporter large permease subunit [Betaproteobacteria bacterium]